MIGGGDFLAGEDFAHGVHEEFLALGVPGVLGCGEAGVVDAGNGLEDAADGGVRAEGVRVGADDVGERGALAGVIVVEGEVCALGFFREGAEEAGEVFFDGVGVVEAFGCEEGFFVEEEGSWGDYAGCEDALAFSGDGFDFPWLRLGCVICCCFRGRGLETGCHDATML